MNRPLGRADRGIAGRGQRQTLEAVTVVDGRNASNRSGRKWRIYTRCDIVDDADDDDNQKCDAAPVDGMDMSSSEDGRAQRQTRQTKIADMDDPWTEDTGKPADATKRVVKEHIQRWR